MKCKRVNHFIMLNVDTPGHDTNQNSRHKHVLCRTESEIKFQNTYSFFPKLSNWPCNKTIKMDSRQTSIIMINVCIPQNMWLLLRQTNQKWDCTNVRQVTHSRQKCQVYTRAHVEIHRIWWRTAPRMHIHWFKKMGVHECGSVQGCVCRCFVLFVSLSVLHNRRLVQVCHF